MESIISSIRSVDPKVRMLGAEALVHALRTKPRLPDVQMQLQLQLFDCVIALIKDVNPKLSVIGLDCLQIITENNVEAFNCMANMSFAATTSKLMDTKQFVRDKASDSVLSLVKFVGLHTGLDRLISLVSSKNNNARESFSKILKLLFISYGEELITYPQIVSKLSLLLQDSQPLVRQLGIELYTQFYSLLGISLISELDSLAIKPNHIKALVDAIRASGQSLENPPKASKLSSSAKVNSNVRNSIHKSLNSTTNIIVKEMDKEIEREKENSEDRGKVVDKTGLISGKSGVTLSSQAATSSHKYSLKAGSISQAISMDDTAVIASLKSDIVKNTKPADECEVAKKSDLSPFSQSYIMSLIAEKTTYAHDSTINGINNSNDMQHFFNKFHKSLQNKDDWQVRVSALFSLQSLLLFNAHYQADAALRSKLVACLRQHQDLIGCQVADIRSAICKEACRTVAIAVIQLSTEATSFIEFILPILLKQIVIKVQVMSQAADKTIRIVISSSTSGYTRLFMSTLFDGSLSKIPAIRHYCVECLLLTVATWKPDAIERSLELYKNTIKGRINDSDQITRKKVRQLYILLSELPSLKLAMKAFLETEIDHSYHKLIFSDMLSPADDLREVKTLLSSCHNLSQHFTKPLLDNVIQTMIVDFNLGTPSATNMFVETADISTMNEKVTGSIGGCSRYNFNIESAKLDEGETYRGDKEEIEETEEVEEQAEDQREGEVLGGGKNSIFQKDILPIDFIDSGPVVVIGHLSADDFKAMAVDPLWSKRVECLEIIQERLLLHRAPPFFKMGGGGGVGVGVSHIGQDADLIEFGTRLKQEKEKEGFFLDLFVDLSVSSIDDAHHKVSMEALRAQRLIILHYQSHMQSKLPLLMMSLFQRLLDRHSNIKDNASDLLETLRITYEPKIIIAALYSTLVDAPDRLKVFIIQYLNVIVPHCDSYFSQPQQAWFFLSRLGVILGDGAGHKPSGTLLEAGKRLVELIYRATPSVVCMQLANLPIQQQSTLKCILASCVPDIDSLVAKAAKQEWNTPSPHSVNSNSNFASQTSNNSRQLSRHSILSYSSNSSSNSNSNSGNSNSNSNSNNTDLTNTKGAGGLTEKRSTNNRDHFPTETQNSIVQIKQPTNQQQTTTIITSEMSASTSIRDAKDRGRGGGGAIATSSVQQSNSTAAFEATASSNAQGSATTNPRDILWLLGAFKVTGSASVKQEALMELKRVAKHERYEFWHMNFPQVVCVLLEAFQSDLLISATSTQVDTNGYNTELGSQKEPPSVYEIASPISTAGSSSHFFVHLNIIMKALMILVKYQAHFVQVFLDLLVTRLVQAASYMPADLTLMGERLLMEVLPKDPLRFANLITPYTATVPPLDSESKELNGKGDPSRVSRSPPGESKEGIGLQNHYRTSSSPPPPPPPLAFDSGASAPIHRHNANVQILALRLIAAAIAQLTSPQLLTILRTLVSSIVPSLSHAIADIRKSGLFALVEAYFLVGDVLYPYLDEMTLAQRKLLTLYIEKLRRQRVFPK